MGTKTKVLVHCRALHVSSMCTLPRQILSTNKPFPVVRCSSQSRTRCDPAWLWFIVIYKNMRSSKTGTKAACFCFGCVGLVPDLANPDPASSFVSANKKEKTRDDDVTFACQKMWQARSCYFLLLAFGAWPIRLKSALSLSRLQPGFSLKSERQKKSPTVHINLIYRNVDCLGVTLLSWWGCGDQ